MSAIETAVKDCLLDDATTAALVDTRVRPFYADQLDVRPFITYQITEEMYTPTYKGRSTNTKVSIQFGLFGDRYSQAIDLSAAVKGVFAAKSVLKDSVKILVSNLTEETDIEEVPQPGTSKPVFIRVQTYTMVYKVIS